MARLTHLRLEDLSDREILLSMLDVTKDGGWVDGPDVAESLGMAGDHPARMVSSRLGWMRRYGAVERELLWDEHGNPLTNRNTGVQKTGQRWRLTEIGMAIAKGELKKAQQTALDNMGDAQLVLAARFVAEAARGSGNATSSKLIEREWKHRWARQNGWTRP